MKRKKPKPIIPELHYPRHLVTFKVPGRAVPWSVPDVGRSRNSNIVYAKKEKRLKSWQKTIAQHAQLEWGYGRPVYEGPIGLGFWFYVGEPAWRQVTPDLANLVKGAEDALQGVVIANDKRTCAFHAERYEVPRGEEQRIFIQVWAIPTVARFEPTGDDAFGFRLWEWPYAQLAV